MVVGEPVSGELVNRRARGLHQHFGTELPSLSPAASERTSTRSAMSPATIPERW